MKKTTNIEQDEGNMRAFEFNRKLQKTFNKLQAATNTTFWGTKKLGASERDIFMILYTLLAII